MNFSVLELSGVVVAFLVALLVVVVVHPQVAKFAIKRKIVDNPDFRKLQRNPVPVMGGVAVFFGLVAGLGVASFFLDITSILPMFLAMSIMLCVGVADDVSNLSPWRGSLAYQSPSSMSFFVIMAFS